MFAVRSIVFCLACLSNNTKTLQTNKLNDLCGEEGLNEMAGLSRLAGMAFSFIPDFPAYLRVLQTESSHASDFTGILKANLLLVEALNQER